MRLRVLIPLIPILTVIGCGESEEPAIAINSIEKSITKEKTNLGCGKEHDGVLEECSEREKSSAEFILSILEKDMESEGGGEDIASIKENLNHSLEEITKEESKKSKLKDSLVALVDEVNGNAKGKRRDLKNFVDNLDDSQISSPSVAKIASIKDELTNLVELGGAEPKEVKKRLQVLIDDVTESKKSLTQTEKSLKSLVKDVEESNTSSAKRFASAIIRDVSDKKISILEETDKFFIIEVQSGDNLSILAKRYYNDKNKFRLIYEANRDRINEKYEIFPNSRLLIPKI